MNISIRARLSVELELVISQTLIDMRGRKPAWEGISPPFNGALVSHYGGFYRVSIFSGVFVLGSVRLQLQIESGGFRTELIWSLNLI